MKLYLTRHGKTKENMKGIIQSHEGGNLSSLGISQAIDLGRRLKNEGIEYIYSSDLKRAVDTALEIASIINPKFIQKTPLLREAYFGKYEGMKKKGIDWRNVDGIESQEDLQKRTKEFYEKIILNNHKINKDDRILVVSHAGTMKALTSILKNIHYDKIWDMPTPKNTALSCFEIREKGINILYENSKISD
ncbi:MAG: histidine phosphatase family protein [Candidatus Thorarchaeota archaeon]